MKLKRARINGRRFESGSYRGIGRLDTGKSRIGEFAGAMRLESSRGIDNLARAGLLLIGGTSLTILSRARARSAKECSIMSSGREEWGWGDAGSPRRCDYVFSNPICDRFPLRFHAGSQPNSGILFSIL